MRWLAGQGLDPNAAAEEAPPLLVVAVRRGTAEMVEALLVAGAEPGRPDAAGNAPLHFAASDGNAAVVRVLLDRGAPVNPANRRGRTPLDLARREEHAAVVALLEKRGGRGTPSSPPRGPYLGQARPGAAPAVFGPDFVSTERRELNVAFSPDARELYFARERAGGGTALFVTRLEGDGWTRPEVAPFSTAGNSDVDLFLTSDGRQAWFCSDRPDPAAAGGPPGEDGRRTSDIWVVSRDGAGWGKPEALGHNVNSDADDYYPTLSGDGTLYFSSNRPGGLGANDVYCARRDAHGKWTAPMNLGPPVNGPGREYDPLVAPDGRWLVFASERPGGFGGADLYVSRRLPDGTWGEPRNLGPSVNSPASEYTPALTPDGRTFLFTRGRAGDDDLYWVDSGVLRASLGEKAAAPAPPLAVTDVVSRCAEAMGGAERVAAVRTLRVRMEIESSGRTVTHEVKRPNRIRSESGYVLVFDGRRAGYLKGAPSKDGKDPGPLLLPPEEGRDFEVDVAFLFPAFLDHPAGYAGTETFGGRPVHVVGVTLPLGARMTYLLDAETFLPVRAVAEMETAEGPYRTGRTFSDFTVSEGLKLPRTVVSEGWAFSGRAAVTKVEVNVPLDDRRFEMP